MIVVVIMRVVVIVSVERQRSFGARSKERTIFRGGSDMLWRAFAADMPVEANHTVRGGHDNVEFMAHHQDRAAEFIADRGDELIEGGGTGLVEALGRLIKDQKLRLAQKRAGQKDALELPAGKLRHLLVAQMVRAGPAQSLRNLFVWGGFGQLQEPIDGQRQSRVDGELLRHVANAQTVRLRDRAGGGRDRPNEAAQQRRLAGSVWPHHSDNLTGVQSEVDVVQNGAVVERDRQALGRDEHG